MESANLASKLVYFLTNYLWLEIKLWLVWWLQSPQHRAHPRRQVDRSGARADAGCVPAGAAAAKGAGQTAGHDAALAHDQAADGQWEQGGNAASACNCSTLAKRKNVEFSFLRSGVAAESVSRVDGQAARGQQSAAAAGAAAARVQRAPQHAARGSAGVGGGALADAAPADAHHGRPHPPQNQW